MTSKSETVEKNNEIEVKRLEIKKTLFDREFRAFVKQAQETIINRYGMSIELGNIRPELVCLNKYLNVYNSMDPSEHFCYFEMLYKRKRDEILNCLKDDSWIRRGNIIIQFGEGIKGSKKIEEKLKQVRIMVSDIFKIAYELQKQAEKSLDGIDEKFAQDVIGKDLIRPNILLLHLMRIFYYLTEGSDKEQIGLIVTQLEADLGVTKRTVENKEVQPSGGLSSLFTLATSMMEKMGYKPPQNMKPPTESEISAVINTVFNNESTQNAIQNMLSSLQGCQDFSVAIREVVKNVTDSKTIEAIQGSVLQTAQTAANVQNNNNTQN